MKVVLATGGSGGHLFPALEVAKILKNKGHDVTFMGSFGVGIERLKKQGFSYTDIMMRGWNGADPFHAAKTFLLTGKAIQSSWRALRAFGPDVVAGFGSYASFPVMGAAVCLRYPTLIHEQNVSPGKANMVLKKFVNKVAISFEQSQKYFQSRKTILTGLPSAYDDSAMAREKAVQAFGLNPEHKTVLVFGGSQGSHAINTIFSDAYKHILQFMSLQVIHISGHQDYGFLAKAYVPFAKNVRLFDFCNKMKEAYCAADFVICRSGAATVVELAQFKKKAIVIPYPFAGGHQKENAKILIDLNQSILLEQSQLSVKSLQAAVESILLPRQENEERYVKTIYQPRATQQLVDAIIGVQ